MARCPTRLTIQSVKPRRSCGQRADVKTIPCDVLRYEPGELFDVIRVVARRSA
jgi:hypothetical protein